MNLKDFLNTLSEILSKVDSFVWGPVMLALLVGTGIFLTFRLGFLTWKNLPFALKTTLSKEARAKQGSGDISPFSALTTALAATIGTGNIVGVATAMVAGGPGALVWMWLSACFGLTSKFSECMLAIKYREVNEKGEMSGGPMYTMKKAFKHKRLGSVLGWLFALFAVIASFGIGNLTQANSISTSVRTAFHIPVQLTGAVITILALIIIVGGIKTISKVSQIVVPFMAIFYMIAGLIVIIGNRSNLPAGVAMIFKMAFSIEAVGGGMCGSIVASMANALRFGVARGVFSNEAGMGSAAITAAAATTDNPVRQGYINMTGTFWDTIVVCTITGLCIASSGVLGTTAPPQSGIFQTGIHTAEITVDEKVTSYDTSFSYRSDNTCTLKLISKENRSITELTAYNRRNDNVTPNSVIGKWEDAEHNIYEFCATGEFHYSEILTGSSLTIAAFETVLGKAGGFLVCIGVALFAFSTILGWEYHGEKAFEYLLHTHRLNIVYRIAFSLIVYIGATTSLQIVWSFSDIANALMAIPNLICLLALSGEIAKDTKAFQKRFKA